MRKTACTLGAFIVGAGVLTGGTAFADSTDNDGVNIGNDNNASVLPIQLCGNNIAVLGAVVPIASPQNAVCTNAPIVDHPQQPPAEEPPTEEPPTEEPPTEEPPAEEPPAEEPPAEEPPTDTSPEDLPEAPSPVAVEGHHAVTG
ncbi:hypothetical protein [Saccharopolyspora griseoalba]|uniref:DUF320 domain-containing protein n=1 Tax=Saccharopolyspora griseoalba TaxID=1431848 RepID=A0ABW2LL53_9PSEU